jgi:hypothetical protein
MILASAASAASTGTLLLSARGLPTGQHGIVRLSGHGQNRVLRPSGARVLKLPAGRYALAVEPVTIGKTLHGVRSGAVAYPAKKKLTATVESGGRTTVAVGYAGIVNPATRALPSTVLGFKGSPEDPGAVLLPGNGKAPSVGTIFVSGSSGQLPRGLISKVTEVKKKDSEYLARLEAVPVTEAVPGLAFEGSVDFQPVDTSASARLTDGLAHASSTCSPPKLLKFGAHLDSFELRQASLGAWPPQMRLTLAIRTTESMALTAVAAGINCDWSLAELGPYQAAIPVGPIVVPVYATIPVKAGVHINGKLNAATINVASTTVASTAAGFDYNHATLSQQGSNVWTSGVLSVSGSAKLSASVGVQAGVGVAKGASVHVNAGFGPEFEWSSGHSCDVYADLGSLSAGVAVLGKNLNTPSWTPIRPRLWSGCPAGGGTTGGAGGSGGSSGGGGDKPGGSPGGTPGGPGTGGETPPGGGGSAGMPWHAVQLPVPPGGDAGSGYGYRPACSDDATCVVTGNYTEGGEGLGMIDTLSGGAWSAVPIPVPPGGEAGSGFGYGDYSDPACADDGTCVVTGVYTEGGVERGMIDTLSGGAWSAVPIPVPPGGEAGSGHGYDPSGGYGYAPACADDGTCVVAADYTEGGEERWMIDTLSGGAWSAVPTPVPPGGETSSGYSAGDGSFEDPSCSNDGTCVMAGDYTEGGVARTMIDTLSGGAWRVVEIPVPPGGEAGSGLAGNGSYSGGFRYENFVDPACSDDGICMIAGEYMEGGYTEGGEELGMIDTLSGGAWGAVPTPVPPAGKTGSGFPISTACSDDGTCVIAGEYIEGGEERAMIVVGERQP